MRLLYQRYRRFRRYASLAKQVVRLGLFAPLLSLFGTPTADAQVITVDGDVSPLFTPGLTTWNIGDNLYVGQTTSGTLTITRGGSATDSNGIIDNTSGSTASVIVDGTAGGATWTNSDGLFVGHEGSGELTLRNSGVATADIALLGDQPTGHGTINIDAAADDAPTTPGILDTPAVVFGSGISKFVFNHTSGESDDDYEFSPIISNAIADSTPGVHTSAHPGSSVDIYAGTTVLTTTGSNYDAPTNIHGGTLAAGNANVFSPNSHHTIHAAGTMDLRGHNQTVADLTNAGTINMGTDTAPETTLTITGNYVGDGGTIILNTQLGSDARTTISALDGSNPTTLSSRMGGTWGQAA